MATSALEATTSDTPTPAPSGPAIWVVLPTYNEAENIEDTTRRILAGVPDARVLIVDDASPDGTGLIADTLAAANPRIEVLHRKAKDGLGRAYLAGFAAVLERGADVVIQMDADGSHDPAALWPLLVPVAAGRADLVIGSRYVEGSRILDWGLGRRLISRGGGLYARMVLGLPIHDLTGGFKAWRGTTLAAIDRAGIHAGGYVFQIEMTARAFDAGARVVEVPIVFRDRRFGTSKMSAKIVREAFLLVLRLGVDRRTHRHPTRASVP